MFNFEKLEVWQDAIDFADLVYSITRMFPDGERFGLTNQMRRAAVSISSNVAEGSSRSSRAGFCPLRRDRDRLRFRGRLPSYDFQTASLPRRSGFTPGFTPRAKNKAKC
jgi:hypothetical protein